MRDSRAGRVVVAANTSSPSDETGQQVEGARETHQEGEVDLAQHWGFSSKPPAGTEEIAILDQYGSRVAVAERAVCPVSLADGEAALWTSSTSFVKIDSNGTVAVRSKSGKKVSIGDYSSTKYGAAWHSGAYATGSKVAVGTPLKKLEDQLKDDLDNVRNTLAALITKVNNLGLWCAALVVNTVTGAPNVAYVDIPLSAPSAVTTTVLAADADHSYVSSGSAHVEVD
jgi:hypothetical protein